MSWRLRWVSKWWEGCAGRQGTALVCAGRHARCFEVQKAERSGSVYVHCVEIRAD